MSIQGNQPMGQRASSAIMPYQLFTETWVQNSENFGWRSRRGSNWRLNGALESAGYFNGLEARITETRKLATIDKTKEISRVKGLLKNIQNQVENLFLLQTDSILNSEARQLLADKLASLAKEKTGLTNYLTELEEPNADARIESAPGPGQFLKNCMVEFSRGFNKAPATLKKRVLRRVVKQIVVTNEGLSLIHLNDSPESGGRNLSLVRDGSSGEAGALIS